MQLFVDLDGVLADFDAGYEQRFGTRPVKADDNVDWKLVENTPNFYRDLPPMHDYRELWTAVEYLNPIVLTGIPHSVKEAADNKSAWVAKNLGPSVPVICCRSSEKSLNCDPGDVLIDDWSKYRHLWTAKGGIFITHTSAHESIQELSKLLSV